MSLIASYILLAGLFSLALCWPIFKSSMAVLGKILFTSLVLSLVVGAWWAYTIIGASKDIAISESLKALSEAPSKEEFGKVKAQVADRLKDKPGDAQYLYLEAMLATQAGDHEGAAQSYERLLKAAPDSAEATAEYAQALYLAKGNVVTAKVLSLALKALSLDSTNITALGLKGILAFELEHFQGSAKAWSRAMQNVGETDGAYRFFASGVSRSLKQADLQTPENAQKAEAKFDQLIADPLQLTGESLASFTLKNKSLSDDSKNLVKSDGLTLEVSAAFDKAFMQAHANDAVFVFARAANGPPMPLAISKIQLKDLPKTVQLSSDMAMMEGMSLEAFERVDVVARLSLSGGVKLQEGDFEAVIADLEWRSASRALKLELAP